MMTSPITYRDSGVDIDAGDALVAAIGDAVRSTRRLGTLGGIGGFGGIFDLAKAGYRDPLLVSATDGVGTKLKLAFETENHRSVGIDLVAMCVNDLIVQGAEPLFFLDYFATSRLDVARAAEVIEGIADGCRIAGCALVGGETAELPAFYDGDEYDLAGFAVGAVERDRLLPRNDVAVGDIVLALPSSGLHSNGFSLVRRILQKSGLKLDDIAPFQHGTSVGEALLTPTSIYAAPLVSALKSNLPVKALCHITGGGLIDNIPRVLPDALGVAIDLTDHPRPAVFDWLAENGPIVSREMARTFNCGVGMVAIISPADRRPVEDEFAAVKLTARQIGTVTEAHAGAPIVTVTGGPGI